MNYIAPEHIALAVAELDDESLVKYFEMLSTSRTFVKNEAERRLKTEKEKESGRRRDPTLPSRRVSASSRLRRRTRAVPSERLLLRPHAARAEDEKIDPIIGRDEEVERVIQILAQALQEQPDPPRRTRRRKDGHRGGPRAANRLR